MKHARILVIICLVIFSFTGFQSCLKEKAKQPDVCGTKIYSFQTDILPILTTHCAVSNCHVPSGLAPYVATDYAALEPYAADGRLMNAITHTGPYPMPRIDALLPDATKLHDTLINKISCWVQQGYPNN